MTIIFTQRNVYVAAYSTRTIEIWVDEKNIVHARGYDSNEHFPWQEKTTKLPLKDVLLWAEGWLRNGGSWISAVLE